MQLASALRTNCVHPMKDFQAEKKKKITWILFHYTAKSLFGTLALQFLSLDETALPVNGSLLRHILTSLTVQQRSSSDESTFTQQPK